ncbi:MAG: hypothetical protein PHY48_11485 [Candidatus Cloacimonetes bacterium]|nr:hypothetical protein [Candidatus Cloacimonadota bacterium]
MKEYQTSHSNQLPPEADADQIERVRQACEWDKIRLGSSAQGNLAYWRIGIETLRQNVRLHIEKGRKVFRKFDPADNTKLLEFNLQANVTLFENKDIYVEMILTQGIFVILNAHEHTTLKRLPQ